MCCMHACSYLPAQLHISFTELFFQDIEGHLYGTVGRFHACIGGIIAAVIEKGSPPKCEVFDDEASIHAMSTMTYS